MVKNEIAVLVCFACPSFLCWVSSVVSCVGGQGPPQEWLIVWDATAKAYLSHDAGKDFGRMIFADPVSDWRQQVEPDA